MKLILGPVIGAVTHNKAKVWIFWEKSQGEETPQCYVFKDKNCSEEIPGSPFKFEIISSSEYIEKEIHGLACLADISFPMGMKKLYYKIRAGSNHNEDNDQTYCIQPFPEAGADVDTFSFALVSCHKPPFKNVKKCSKLVNSMWCSLGDQMEKDNCRFLIQAGDQVYSDHEDFNAWELCQQTNSPEQRLGYYRKIYLKSWKFPEVQKVMKTFPQYMIWDDHEITNSWGSEKKHSQADCQEIFKIARQAYIEFQHCHNPDPLCVGELYYALHYGPASFLFMDLRGHRDINLYNSDEPDSTYPLAGDKQWNDIEVWFASDVVQNSKILFVVTSVPVCHLSRKFGSLGIFKSDVNDQWSTEHNKRERRKLLKLLYKWSGKNHRPVCILGGDAHVGTVAEITNCQSKNTIYQVTSSPITNKAAYFLDLFLTIFSSKFDFHLDDGADKKKVSVEITRRYRRRNFAIIEVKFNEHKPKVDVYMYEQDRIEDPDTDEYINK